MTHTDFQRSLLRGISNQDQGLECIRSVWDESNPDTIRRFCDLLESTDTEYVLQTLNEEGEPWVLFLTQCAICGIRQAIINKYTTDTP